MFFSRLVVTFVITVALCMPIRSQTPVVSWDSCQDDLDGLQKAAADASDAAGDAPPKARRI